VGEETYGVTYRWRDDQKDADLVGPGSQSGPDGWTFPSRDDCMRCHTPQAGWVLGVRTRQLALENQLEEWRSAGLVAVPADAKPVRLVDPRDGTAPLESRVRSYLDANCMHCHAPNGSGRGWFDARATTPLAEAGIVDGPVAEPLGIAGARVARSGQPQLSLLLDRMRRTDARRMPPVAVARPDDKAIAMLDEWIRGLEPRELEVVGLRGEYFTGLDLARLVRERTDPAVDFEWGGAAPVAGLKGENFSVRWRGFVEVPRSGEWTLRISVDDGGRLFVDGKKVIDKWVDQGETEHSVTLTLEAGRKIPIAFEYYQRGGNAAARLLWSGPDQPRATIPPRFLTPLPPRRFY
jgi:hypothetical protein